MYGQLVMVLIIKPDINIDFMLLYILEIFVSNIKYRLDSTIFFILVGLFQKIENIPQS